MTSPSEACHRFQRWYYPYPQRCGKTVLFVPTVPNRSFEAKAPEQNGKIPEQITFVLPPIDFTICPEGDSRLLGIAKLRALSDVAAGWR